VYGCHVTGIDLTQAFCDTADALSEWVNLGDRVTFQQGDATNLHYDDNQFDAAMTIHVAMNIPDKDKVYSEARRVVKPGRIFAVYDVLQGEGGDVLFPVPWARKQGFEPWRTRFLFAPGPLQSEARDRDEQLNLGDQYVANPCVSNYVYMSVDFCIRPRNLFTVGATIVQRQLAERKRSSAAA
jgi:ubiquinone/menaquinone biosynthesis C-methylase UbiE